MESTGSTNDDLMAAADAGAPTWSVLVAGHQTAGRGRLGRSWEEPSRSSLLVSVLLRPSDDATLAPLLSLFAARVMAQGIQDTAQIQVFCEWPNDLVTWDGRKLGGLLLESRIEQRRLLHVVVGLGLNLTQTADDFPQHLRRPATSIAMEGGLIRPESLLRSYLFRLRQRLFLDHPRAASWMASDYYGWCATIGRRVRARTVDGAVVEGTAVDIGEHGELLVETAQGRVAVSSGELERLD